jgi:hypothetical protein
MRWCSIAPSELPLPTPSGTGVSCVRAAVRAKGAEQVQIYQAPASFASG